MSLVAYRNLMRAARIAFQGDAHILAAAQLQIREEFKSKASLNASDETTKTAIAHAQEVAKILRENVVQGRQTPSTDNNTPTYKLNIHEHTERGDNESIKYAGSGSTTGGCGCK